MSRGRPRGDKLSLLPARDCIPASDFQENCRVHASPPRSVLSAAFPRGVVAFARKSGTGCGAVACWGLGLVVVLRLPWLAVSEMMVRAARDAEPLWDKSPFISLALGPDPVGRFLLPRARWSDFAFTH